MKNGGSNVNKSSLLMTIAVLLIVAFIGYQFYSVTHIELKTLTATLSTVYDKVDSQALFIREEKVVHNSDSGVTVPCFSDGDKINVDGNVAMIFSSSKAATNYSKYAKLQEQIEYYEDLESQTVGQSANLETINEDIEQKVLNYADGLNKNNVDVSAGELDSVLVRRQLIIGENIDLISIIQNLRQEQEKYSENAKPDDYIKTKVSGVFSTCTDGYENIIDYDSVEETTVKQFQAALKAVDKRKNVSSNLGKLVTSYTWYVETMVDSDTVQYLENGDYVRIALKDKSNIEYKAEIITGAEPALGQKQTLLIMKLNEMNSDIAKLRKAEIEIRRSAYEGFRVPVEALHFEDGKKGVYALIASQVKFREATVIYSDDDYALIAYEPDNSNAIHLYDKIITQGKDLEDGKVYT